MSDQLLVILRICLLALVYLTFFRVLRAIWVELRAETPRAVASPTASPVAVPVPAMAAAAPAGAPIPPPASTPPTGARLVVLAPLNQTGASYLLQPETTLGRAAGCGVVLDDTRVSKLHARVFFSAGRWVAEDLGSTNGTLVNEELLDGSRELMPGDRIQLGDVVMELA